MLTLGKSLALGMKTELQEPIYITQSRRDTLAVSEKGAWRMKRHMFL